MFSEPIQFNAMRRDSVDQQNAADRIKHEVQLQPDSFESDHQNGSCQENAFEVKPILMSAIGVAPSNEIIEISDE